MTGAKDIHVESAGHVTTIEIRRPPLNFSISLIRQIARTRSADRRRCRLPGHRARGRWQGVLRRRGYGASGQRRPNGPRQIRANSIAKPCGFSQQKPIVAAVRRGDRGWSRPRHVGRLPRHLSQRASRRTSPNLAFIGFGHSGDACEAVGRTSGSVFYTSRRVTGKMLSGWVLPACW